MSSAKVGTKAADRCAMRARVALTTVVRRTLSGGMWVVFGVGALLVLAGCAAPASSGTPPPPSGSGGGATRGPATPSAATSGDWQVLFDGSISPALRGYGQAGFPEPSWRVEGSELHAVPGRPVDLVTLDTYEDFELEFEWRVARGGNSGVMYRVVESADPAWASGPEYQVLDDAGHSDGRRAETSAAAVYDLIAPETKRLQPVGTFNESRIVVRDGSVEHWLNGSRVLAYDWRGADVEERIAGSKFRDLPTFMRAEAGAIVFQHHGEEVWFRDLRIRRL
jgi:hypothetical protein